MSIFNSLINFLKKGENASQESPEGICPNCWGRSEYGGQFFEAVKNNNTDVNSQNPNVGWVQDYADKHLSAIELKPEDGKMVCQKCKVSYRLSE